MRPEKLNPLFVPVTELDGIGPKLGRSLAQLLTGRDSAEPPRICDLIFHLPHSVIDRRHQPSISQAMEGQVASFKVIVDRHFVPPRGNRRIPYRIKVHDNTGEMTLVFFQARGDWLEKAMPVGETRIV